MAGFEWFTGGTDRSKKARENCVTGEIIVNGEKSDNVKVTQKLESFNLLYRNFRTDWISSV